MFKKFLAIATMMFLTSAWAQPSVVVYDIDQHKIIEQTNAYEVRPIASITKLMTAIVALDHYNLEDKIAVTKKQFTTVGTLLTSLLVRSDNKAAEILAKNYPGGRSAFISAMNNKAKIYNLSNTKFIDPSGLGIFNLSTAVEVTGLVGLAAEYSFIRTIAHQPEIYTVVKTKYGYKEQPVYSNTNKELLSEFDNIKLSKTGYTSHAGRCLTMLIEKNDQKQIIVILGEPTKKTRDNLARQLIAQNS